MLNIPVYKKYSGEKKIALLDNSTVSFMLQLENWMKDMYTNWPMLENLTKDGRIKKKNAGEISLTILSEIFSWHYPETELLTIYTQDTDSYAFQKCAEEKLKKIFKNKTPISVTYRSNDSILCQLFKNKQLEIEEIEDIRKDIRNVTYTLERADKTIVLEMKKLDNEEFKKLILNNTVQIIF